jgi:hypothetical protein
MRTPVPKCLDMKRNWCGTGIEGKRLTTMGKEQAAIVSAAWEGATSSLRTRSTQDKYEEQRENMNGCVVMSFTAFGLAFGPFIVVLLSPEQFRVEDMRRYFRET